LASSTTKSRKISLVGNETLLGRELQEVIKNRDSDVHVKTYAASAEGSFAEEEGEPVYLDPLDARSIGGDQAIVFAGSQEGAGKTYELVKAAGGRPSLIDCTGYLEDRPEARVTDPLGQDPDVRAAWLFVLAHPAASTITSMLTRLARYRSIRQAIIHVFEPASQLGKRGINELHQQTTGLLAFKPLDKATFDAQISFNLLAQYGEEAPAKLGAAEGRIERDVATLLSRHRQAAAIPMPSLRLIQVPVFHGYSLSFWVEFDGDITAQALGEAIASAQIEVRGHAEEAPNSVGVAGQSGLMVGDIRLDRNNACAAWLWCVGDNLRITADGAVNVLRQLETAGQ
jgi:aspartate-semialdehyde dehydrogenase